MTETATCGEKNGGMNGLVDHSDMFKENKTQN